jgi:hypothetical protein
MASSRPRLDPLETTLQLAGWCQRILKTDRPGRKVRTRLTAEAVVGGVLGSIAHPEALIVGRYDAGVPLVHQNPSAPVRSPEAVLGGLD